MMGFVRYAPSGARVQFVCYGSQDDAGNQKRMCIRISWTGNFAGIFGMSDTMMAGVGHPIVLLFP